MTDRRTHWENVYRNKAVNEVSWFQPQAASSLRLIEGCAGHDAAIIDVGGALRCWSTTCSTRVTTI